MIKSYIYFTEEQNESIKAQVKKTGKSKAKLVREAIDQAYTTKATLKKQRKSKYLNIEDAFSSLKGTVLKYEDPFEPAVDPNDWEVLKE